MNPASASGETPSILVVDDTPANLQLLAGMLKEHGYRVRPVPNGKLALQAVRSTPPDLILLDINMPQMDGYEVCRQLKQDERLAGIPVIFISALNEALDKVKAFAAGGVDFVTKPFQVEEVEARVKTHLTIRRLQQELERHNAHLEDVVVQRTRQLAEAKQRLGVLDKAKSEFLTLLSHEARSPLNSVFVVADLLFDECLPSATLDEYRDLFDLGRRRIMTLLDDAILLTKIELEGDKSVLRPCPLTPIVDAAVERTATFARSRNVRLDNRVHDLGYVLGESELLEKAVHSLLETAVKFSEDSTSVRLIGSTSPADAQLVIEAAGRAIPLDALPRFFDVLAIAEAITPGGDLGLAPAVAERILSALGGSVTLENLSLPGIRLTVALKAVDPASADA
jgi:two-component system, sensor histidine kinase and response regulator